jgi:hypothetical protein
MININLHKPKLKNESAIDYRIRCELLKSKKLKIIEYYVIIGYHTHKEINVKPVPVLRL